MTKNFLLSIALFTIVVLLAGCGGPGSSTGIPRGVNPGVPSVVQLLDVQNIAQTNSNITFKAKVLDGNGKPVHNEPVTFINLSSIGTFKSAFADSGVTTFATAPTVVLTDYLGHATINLLSTSSGFVTVQAEVNTGVGQVRDQRTVFFTTSDTLDMRPTLTLDVDGDGDGIFNETGPVGNDDFTLFETATDNVVIVRATFKDGIGRLLVDSTVTFGADVPFRVGADPTAECSDGSDTCEVTFPFGNTATTNSIGQAFVSIQVTPAILRTITTILNITAQADFAGFRAFNIVTLFLSPVTVTTVTVSANPPVVESGGTSTITAFVLTSAGTPVPDGTSVNFTTTAGGIEPFAQTTDGIAEVEFTAPTVTADTTVTITATVVGVFDTTTVTVTAEPLALIIVPSTAGVNGVLGGTVTFTISGGTPTYTVTSDDPVSACSSTDADCSDASDTGVWTGIASGGTITVTVPAGTSATSVSIDVTDSVGGTASATLTITTGPPLSVLPTSGTVTGINNPVAVNCPPDANATDDLVLTISGGTPPYIAVSSDLVVIPACALSLVGSTLTVDPDNVAVSTPVTVTISDSSATVQSVAVIVTVVP